MNFKEAAKGFLNWRLSLLVAGTTYVVAGVVKWLSQYIGTVTLVGAVTPLNPEINVRNQILAQGAAPQAGNYVFDFFKGYIPNVSGDLWGFLIGILPLVIGTFILVGIGTMLVNWGSWANKITKGSAIKDTALKLGVGAVAATVLLALPMGGKTFLGLDFWTTAIAMLIYYLGVAGALALFYKIPMVAKFGAKV